MNQLAVIEDSIRAVQPIFESVAVDRGMSFDRECEFAMQIMSASDYLQDIALKCPQSMVDAVTNISAIGLSLNPARKLVYLVPRKSKICLDISYMGLIELATNTGSVRWAQAALVYEDDSFTLNGYDKAPTHSFSPFAKSRGALVGAYAVCKTADGDFLTETMTIDEVYAIRNRSDSWKGGKASPWKTDEGEMVKKTVVKRASKYWPKTERLQNAISYMNTQGGEGIELVGGTTEDQPEPVRGKPAVAMPQARAEQPVTDVQPKEQVNERQPEQPKESPQRPERVGDAALASPGEIAYLTNKLVKKGMTPAQAREAAGLEPATTLAGLTKDGFIAIKDIVK